MLRAISDVAEIHRPLLDRSRRHDEVDSAVSPVLARPNVEISDVCSDHAETFVVMSDDCPNGVLDRVKRGTR
jgi:hypothetical protein